MPPPRRRRAWPWLIAVVGFSALLAAGVGLWEFSSSPMFCNSCHIMRPYVQAWKLSTHRNIACVQCHYPPGFRDTLWVKYQAMTQVVKWATQTYSSKPFAQVEDGSCLRSGCHARAQLETAGAGIFKRAVRFDHRPHLEAAKMGRNLRCTTCHTQLVVNTHIEVDQAACFLCHFKGVKLGRELMPIAGCAGCHETPKGDILIDSIRFNHEEVVSRGVACQKCHLNVVEGEGEAPRERCITCHNQPEKLQKYPETRAIHEAHVAGHNIECRRCHTEIKHGLPPPIGLMTAAEGRRIVSGRMSAAR